MTTGQGLGTVITAKIELQQVCRITGNWCTLRRNRTDIGTSEPEATKNIVQSVQQNIAKTAPSCLKPRTPEGMWILNRRFGTIDLDPTQRLGSRKIPSLAGIFGDLNVQKPWKVAHFIRFLQAYIASSPSQCAKGTRYFQRSA